MKMFPYSAVLFDFDGTLADSYDAIAASVNHVRSLHGLAPIAVEEVKRHVGRGPGYLLTHTVGQGDLAEYEKQYRAHHPSVMQANTRLLPGAREVLTALRRIGIKTGVCSNKPRGYTGELLAGLSLTPLLDVVVGPEDVARPKPAPDMLLQALRQLQIAPEYALYVGDMCVDIETARAAGVHVWIVPTGSDERTVLEQARPDRLLTSLSELHDCIP